MVGAGVGGNEGAGVGDEVGADVGVSGMGFGTTSGSSSNEKLSHSLSLNTQPFSASLLYMLPWIFT